MSHIDKRVRYYNGQFLQEQDFRAEQSYHLDRQRKHNQHLHSPGIAEGLEVTANEGATSVTVSPGTAIDHEGRMIVLTGSRTLSLGTSTGSMVVVISYAEQESDPATAGDEGDTRYWELPVVEVIREADAQEAHGEIPLARLQLTNGMVSSHDKTVRHSAGKLGTGTLEVPNPLGSSAQFVQDQNGNQSPLAIGTGKVGIGTNKPECVLSIAGDISSAPMVEARSQGGEASIRYTNKNGGDWQVGVGPENNFFFLNRPTNASALFTPEGVLTAKGLKASTNAPGLALTVAGNTGDGPMAELKSQGNEASIRYADNDSTEWIAGSGGQAGPGNFFFWNNEKKFVAKIAPDGTLTANGLKAVTSTPGIAFEVVGDTTGRPIAEVRSVGDEASIRYVDNDGVAWHVGSGGNGGPKNFFFYNDANGIVATLTPEGALTAKDLRASTNAPGIAFTVSGASSDGPVAELKSTGNETSIRYSDNDGTDWIAGSGGQGGKGNFFFWNNEKKFVAKIAPDGTLTANGLKAVTSTPGIAFEVVGDTTGRPIAEVRSVGDEASIRYVNSDGSAWHIGSGGHGGAKNFFFWNATHAIVVTVTPEGNLDLKGGLTAKGEVKLTNLPLKSSAPDQSRLRQLMVDPDSGKIYRTD